MIIPVHERGPAVEPFYVFDDDWALIPLLPAANNAWARASFAASAKHHRRTRFSISGWRTSPYLIPDAGPQLSQLAIEMDTVNQMAFACGLTSVPLTSSETAAGHASEVPDGFAYRAGPHEDTVLYGTRCNAVVNVLAVAPGCEHDDRLVRLLGLLGRQFDLILVDHSRHVVVSLTDDTAIHRYLRPE